MKKLGNMGAVGLGLLGVALIPALLSMPVWKQNRYMGLMKAQLLMEKELHAVEDTLIRLDRQILELKSLQRLESVAANMGLGFHSVPTKVMEIPRAHGGTP